jgi:putative membrane protein
MGRPNCRRLLPAGLSHQGPNYHSFIAWPLDPTVYAGLVALFLGHAWLARRAPDAERKHTLYFGLGLLTLWVALETPIDTISDYSLDSVHMLQHVLLGFVAPPLMLLGLSPGMVAKLLRVPGLRAITEPVPAQLIAGSIMIGWHVPSLYDATLHSPSLHVVEHLMFIAGGLVLYWPILEATSAGAHWRMSPAAKLVYMLVATLPQDGVALVLLFSRVPFYEFYAHVPRLITSLTPLIDQTLAGAVLMILGKATLAVAAMAVFFRWFGGEHRADQNRVSPRAEPSIRG